VPTTCQHRVSLAGLARALALRGGFIAAMRMARGGVPADPRRSLVLRGLRKAHFSTRPAPHRDPGSMPAVFGGHIQAGGQGGRDTAWPLFSRARWVLASPGAQAERQKTARSSGLPAWDLHAILTASMRRGECSLEPLRSAVKDSAGGGLG